MGMGRGAFVQESLNRYIYCLPNSALGSHVRQEIPTTVMQCTSDQLKIQESAIPFISLHFCQIPLIYNSLMGREGRGG